MKLLLAFKTCFPLDCLLDRKLVPEAAALGIGEGDGEGSKPSESRGVDTMFNLLASAAAESLVLSDSSISLRTSPLPALPPSLLSSPPPLTGPRRCCRLLYRPRDPERRGNGNTEEKQ